MCVCVCGGGSQVPGKVRTFFMVSELIRGPSKALLLWEPEEAQLETMGTSTMLGTSEVRNCYHPTTTVITNTITTIFKTGLLFKSCPIAQFCSKGTQKLPTEDVGKGVKLLLPVASCLPILPSWGHDCIFSSTFAIPGKSNLWPSAVVPALIQHVPHLGFVAASPDEQPEDHTPFPLQQRLFFRRPASL